MTSRPGEPVVGMQRLRPAQWALWRTPLSALLLLLLIDAGAIAAITTAAWHANLSEGSISRFILLSVLAGTFLEVIDRSERIRRYLSGPGMKLNPDSIWSTAAIVALPVEWAVLFVGITYAHRLIRGGSTAPYRLILTGSAAALATVAASTAATGTEHALTFITTDAAYVIALIAMIIIFQVVDFILVGSVAILVIRPTSWREIFANSEELTFEYVIMILGVFTGEVLLYTPWLTPGVLLIMPLLYRAAMVTRLQTESSTDQKTGLLNFTAWREATVRSLARTARLRQPVALMLIDLDHFKRVNDTYGHMVGDEVLTAVANCLRTDLREYDAIGRFGGEEFVVFLDNADLYAAVAAANRLRTSIGQIVISDTVTVTASVGIAHSSKSMASLEVLLDRADAALYEAKAGGRDQVRAVAAVGEIGSVA